MKKVPGKIKNFFKYLINTKYYKLNKEETNKLKNLIKDFAILFRKPIPEDNEKRDLIDIISRAVFYREIKDIHLDKISEFFYLIISGKKIPDDLIEYIDGVFEHRELLIEDVKKVIAENKKEFSDLEEYFESENNLIFQENGEIVISKKLEYMILKEVEARKNKLNSLIRAIFYHINKIMDKIYFLVHDDDELEPKGHRTEQFDNMKKKKREIFGLAMAFGFVSLFMSLFIPEVGIFLGYHAINLLRYSIDLKDYQTKLTNFNNKKIGLFTKIKESLNNFIGGNQTLKKARQKLIEIKNKIGNSNFIKFIKEIYRKLKQKYFKLEDLDYIGDYFYGARTLITEVFSLLSNLTSTGYKDNILGAFIVLVGCFIYVVQIKATPFLLLAKIGLTVDALVYLYKMIKFKAKNKFYVNAEGKLKESSQTIYDKSVRNPKTGEMIKISTALSYGEKHPAYHIAKKKVDLEKRAIKRKITGSKTGLIASGVPGVFGQIIKNNHSNSVKGRKIGSVLKLAGLGLSIPSATNLYKGIKDRNKLKRREKELGIKWEK